MAQAADGLQNCMERQTKALVLTIQYKHTQKRWKIRAADVGRKKAVSTAENISGKTVKAKHFFAIYVNFSSHENLKMKQKMDFKQLY